MSREPMKTISGLSVRREIDMRIAQAEEEARAAAFDEAINFLGASGHLAAAEDLRLSAFGQQNEAAS